jgi:hypothetical protein
LPRLLQLGAGRAEVESLEQMVCLGLWTVEVVPHVLPAEAVERFVQLFWGEALFEVDALDIVGRVEAISPASEVVALSGRRWRPWLIWSERHTPLDIGWFDPVLRVDVQRFLRRLGRRQN